MTLVEYMNNNASKEIIDGINRSVKNPENFEVESVDYQRDWTEIKVYGKKLKSNALIRIPHFSV